MQTSHMFQECARPWRKWGRMGRAIGLLALGQAAVLGVWSVWLAPRSLPAKPTPLKPDNGTSAAAGHKEVFQRPKPMPESTATVRGPAEAGVGAAPRPGHPPQAGGPGRAGDIRQLSQHFLDPRGNTAPWMFIPKDNIKSLSTSEHPGMVAIWAAGKGKDIKGILQQPIAIGDYPLPWEFHLGLVQNSLAIKGLSEGQINYAIGLNLVLTFSAPAAWPRDRTRQPPKTHSAQLFVVHLGNQGENYRPGLPQVRDSALNFHDHSPEVYLVYGRGDLAPNIVGNWQMGYTWVGPDPSDSGTWSKRGGPADPVIRFRVSMLSPTRLEIGIGYSDHPGWRMRTVDVSRFGKVKGVWEIGPIISLDRWIPDVLARALELNRPPTWLDSFRKRQKLLGKFGPSRDALFEDMKAACKVQPPDPAFAYYVDYAVFYGNGPENVEHLSDDFDIPGFLADQKYYIEGNALCETYSNPGYLTVTLYGTNGSWGMCPILRADAIDFTHGKKPPFEMEIAFISPEDAMPWNLWWNVGLFDEKGKFYPWQPGLKNVPKQGCKFFNKWTMDPAKVEDNPVINLQFDPPLPQSILAHKPVYMLIQIPDEFHLRVGFKADKKAPWTFSKAFDSSKVFGKIAKFAYPCLVSFQGRGVGGKGWGAGNYPGYQKFMLDYWYYRYRLSKPSSVENPQVNLPRGY